MTHVACTRNGIALAGRPFYLLAGQIHYFRYPQAEWRSLLLSARAAGLNTIDFVIPWNLHEPQEGRTDFSDMADLPAFIDLCHELGLKVIARPGPYICAEWENGGIPNWLAARPGIAYRLDNPTFLDSTLRWFDVLIPLLASRQADRGGPIILVQIENEHWASGVYGHDGHQATLAQALIARGITVPLYTCMGAMPGVAEFRNGWTGLDRKLQQTRRAWPDNPMIVSELWSGWFDNWGASRHNGKSTAGLDARLHELTAVGVSGLSHWMWAGGTNFGFWGGRTVGGDTVHMTTSYDYDAPVSEYGELTAKYFVARRHHLFLDTLGSTLAPLLAAAGAGGPTVVGAKAVAGRAGGGGEPLVSVRRGDFAAAFLRNDTSDRQVYQVFHQPDAPDSPPIHLAVEVEAFSIKPVFFTLPLADSGLALRCHTGRILGFWRWPNHDVLVIYGSAGETGRLALADTRHTAANHADAATPTTAGWQLQATPPGVSGHAANDGLYIEYWLHETPTVVRATRPSAAGAERDLTILLLTQACAERCWPVGEAGFLLGPHVVNEAALDADGTLHARLDPRGSQPWYWVAADGRIREMSPDQETQALPPTVAPALGVWESATCLELEANEGWQPLGHPAVNAPNTHGYAWVRGRFQAAQAQVTTLTAPGLADRGHLFVDGAFVGVLGVGPDGPRLALPITLAAGAHELRLLIDDLGRFNYGSGLGEIKGLTDTLYLGGQQEEITHGWTALWQEAAFAGEALANARPAHVRPDARDVDLANFAPPPGAGSDIWLLRELPAPAGRRALLYLTGDRNPGALFINGQPLIRFSRHFGGGFFKFDISEHLRPDGANVAALHIRDYAGQPWRAWLLTYDADQALNAVWEYRAGVHPTVFAGVGVPGSAQAPADEPAISSALLAGSSSARPARPVFLRTRFAYDPARHGAGPFKLSLGGLRKGHLWLNGRSLGRYWQIGPQEFYKAPASWLAAVNELVIFEEEEGTPAGARLWTATAAAARFWAACTGRPVACASATLMY